MHDISSTKHHRAKPRPLAVAIAMTVASMGAALAGAATVLIGGPQALRGFVEDYVGEELGVTGGSEAVLDLALDEVYVTVQSRAVLWIVLAGLGFLAVLTARKGKTAGRVFTTTILLLGVAFALLNLADALPTALQVCSTITLLTAVGAIVAFWLPAVGRYAKQP
ncbi:hypothetical protein [Actinokineospora sp. HUAS TT18]|uniref:hypothetical protein n=1 Tax=Actinokineospora sp. HUAS TT18 TaxID=3447451 RepID=UPI003F525DEE